MAPTNAANGSWPGAYCVGTRFGQRLGFTAVEMILVLVLIGVAAAIAGPSVARMRTRAAVHNGKQAVVSAISLAKATAIRYGRPAGLRLDAAGDRVWVEVDTTAASSGVRDTLGLFHLGAELGVELKSTQAVLCFDSRGIATTNAVCGATGAEIFVALGDMADTITVTGVGRVID